MERQMELLKKAAEAFDDQRSPFCTEWLTENDVTADECFGLSQTIAVILHGYGSASKDVQMQITLQGACIAAGMPAEVTQSAGDHLRLGQLTKELENLPTPSKP